MTQNRIWVLLSALVIVAMVAGTWFLAVSPRLSEVAIANEGLATSQSQNAAQTATLNRLKAQFENIDTLRSDLGVVQESVPAQANQSPLVAQLSAMAAAHGVTITSLTFGDPVPFSPYDTVDPLVAEPMAVLTPENFFSFDVQVGLAGDYAAMMDFVGDMQSGDRLLQVYNLALIDDVEKGPTYTVSAKAFILVDAATAAANAPVTETAETEAEAGDTL